MSSRTSSERPKPAWIFADFDGTLADTLGVAREVYRAFAARCGFAPSDGEFAELNGPSLPEIVALLASRHGVAGEHAELLARYRALWAEALAAAAPKPGASELLAEARRRDIPVAIVTSGSAAFIERFAATHGWTGAVAMVVSGDEVARSKPDPAIYRLALERARCAPERAVAIEDAVHGVAAAAAAGIAVVGVADGSVHSADPARLRAAGARAVIGSLGEFFAQERGAP